MAANLEQDVDAIGLGLTSGQYQRLARFRDLLASGSREINLTSLRDPDAIEKRHIVESLAFGALLQRRGLLHGPRRVVDIGTGAGLPGIPLRIAWPELRVTLLESIGKKCRFLEAVRDDLELGGIEVIESRAEELGRDPGHRESYDLAVARAVAPLPVLLEYALPLLRTGGWLAAQKGSAALREVDASATALRALNGRLHDMAPFEPPHGLRQTVVFVEKTAAVDDRYPRRSGIPSKRPL